MTAMNIDQEFIRRLTVSETGRAMLNDLSTFYEDLAAEYRKAEAQAREGAQDYEARARTVKAALYWHSNKRGGRGNR